MNYDPKAGLFSILGQRLFKKRQPTPITLWVIGTDASPLSLHPPPTPAKYSVAVVNSFLSGSVATGNRVERILSVSLSALQIALTI